MAVVGPTLFAVLLWGAIVGVFAVFLYEVSAVVGDLDRSTDR